MGLGLNERTWWLDVDILSEIVIITKGLPPPYSDSKPFKVRSTRCSTEPMFAGLKFKSRDVMHILYAQTSQIQCKKVLRALL